jgi:hypothetical protein
VSILRSERQLQINKINNKRVLEMAHTHTTHNVHHAFIPQVEQVRIRHEKLGTPQAHDDKGEASSKLDIYTGNKARRGMKRQHEARETISGTESEWRRNGQVETKEMYLHESIARP